ncbi:MAG TPA: (2Fe-2S)-binding protein [Terriglobales bacterium]|jgi:aerobic-type carbon monoxide dehydrogenase small subunit (CoxS/CutS family)|nr:(2Fe-2S)-binding protein [Terriglobales bacterium]
MRDAVQMKVNGVTVRVPRGSTVAAAVLLAGRSTFRRSVSGELRGPLCGMGICFECRVAVDGQLHVRSCQMLCREGMEVTLSE